MECVVARSTSTDLAFLEPVNKNSKACGKFPEDAAEWMARRDRGMTAEEQDRYLEWLREDTSRRGAVAQMERTWSLLDQLKEWRPSDSRQPNPDLLALPRSRWSFWSYPLVAAAAVILLTALFFAVPASRVDRQHQAIIHPGAERLVLDDGSTVELNAGAEIRVVYTPEERRVILLRGEGLFTVAKNPERPFVVAADCVAVRALGTTFAVSLNSRAVSVLVTEGKVRVDDAAERPGAVPQLERELSHVVAGQQALIKLINPAVSAERVAEPVLQLRDVTPAEIEQALSWQNLRLEFIDMPLRDVVAEFNRYNGRKLAIADEATGAIVVGGSFRADHVESFVRLLVSGFGVTSSVRGNEIVLRKEP